MKNIKINPDSIIRTLKGAATIALITKGRGQAPPLRVGATLVVALMLLLGIVPNRVYAGEKVIAVLPFKNLHEKQHLEFVKNIAHEAMFTRLAKGSPEEISVTIADDSKPANHNLYIVIGVSSLEDARKLYKISKRKVPTLVLQGEYFMIRDRLALNISLLNPKDGERIEGTGELVKFKGYRYSNLPKTVNFQKSLSEDMEEPLDKLLVGIWDLLEGRKKDAKK